MNKLFSKRSRKKANVLDLLLVFIVTALVAGIVIMFLYDDYGPLGKNKTHIEEYVVTFVTLGSENDNTQYFTKDTLYRLDPNNAYFGTVCTEPTAQPVYSYDFTDEGVVRIETGEKTVVSSCVVNGCYKSEGFMLNGNTYVAPGMFIPISSDEFSSNVQILSIKKAD